MQANLSSAAKSWQAKQTQITGRCENSMSRSKTKELIYTVTEI